MTRAPAQAAVWAPLVPAWQGGEGTGVRGRENEGCWLRSEHFMHLPPLQRAADVEVSNGQLDPLACFSLLTVVVPF